MEYFWKGFEKQSGLAMGAGRAAQKVMGLGPRIMQGAGSMYQKTVGLPGKMRTEFGAGRLLEKARSQGLTPSQVASREALANQPMGVGRVGAALAAKQKASPTIQSATKRYETQQAAAQQAALVAKQRAKQEALAQRKASAKPTQPVQPLQQTPAAEKPIRRLKQSFLRRYAAPVAVGAAVGGTAGATMSNPGNEQVQGYY